MDSKICELCQSPGKLICFCRKAILCDLCIGKHFLAEPSLSHKPISLSQPEVARVYEEHIHQLHRSEERLLGEAQVRQAVTKLSREKIATAIEKLDVEIHTVRITLNTLREAVIAQVNDTVDKLAEDLVSRCERQKEILRSAAHHLEGVENHPDNAVVQALKEVRSVAQAEALEVVKCRIEVATVDVSEELRKAVHFSMDLLRHESAKVAIPEAKVLAKVGPGKKPLSKPAPALNSKASQSLNTSAVGAAPDHALDTSKLSKRLGGLKQSRGKGGSPPPPSNCKKNVTADRRRTLYDVGQFLQTPEQKPSGARSDNEASGADDSETEAAPPMRRFGTEVPQAHTSPMRAAKLTSLQSARAKTRQTLLHETARKVEDIAEQVRELKMSPRVYSARTSVLPEPQVDPDEIDKKHDASRTSIKPGEKSLTPTEQLSITITRAAEVSKALIPKSENRIPSPRPTRSHALLTYEVIGGTNHIRVLSLEANVYSTMAVELPDGEAFSEHSAWCVDAYGKVYILGGRAGDGNAQKKIFEYDPVTSAIETGYMMLTGRFRHSVAAFDDCLVVTGGVGAARTALRDCERFDPQRKAIRRIGTLTVPREGHGSCVYSGALFVAGGSQASDCVEKLIADSFTPLPVSVILGSSAVLVPTKDRIIVLHGGSVSHLQPEAGTAKTVATLTERDWWSAGQPVVLSRAAYIWLRDGVYRLDFDRGLLEKTDPRV